MSDGEREFTAPELRESAENLTIIRHRIIILIIIYLTVRPVTKMEKYVNK